MQLIVKTAKEMEEHTTLSLRRQVATITITYILYGIRELCRDRSLRCSEAHITRID